MQAGNGNIRVSQEKDGRGARWWKAFRIAEIVRASRCGRWKRSRPRSKKSEGSRRNESRKIGGGDGGSEERSITRSLGRLTKLQRTHGGCPKRYACRETRVSPVSRIGRSKPPGARSTVLRAAMFEER